MIREKINNVIFFFFILIIFFISKVDAKKISIKFYVDDEIITNVDIDKEVEYLKILNPQLQEIDNSKINDLAKNTLINEIIKKKEIKKFLDINEESSFTDEQFKNLYTKLNFKSEDDFNKFLKSKNGLSIEEVKNKIKIELMWNELIFLRYKDQIKIDKNKIISHVNNLEQISQNEYLLSEILFTKNKDISLDELINKIKLSINEIGFSNTASLYSISKSANMGGKLDWINEDSLSKFLLEKLKLINVGEYTDVIKIGNDFIILKINKVRRSEVKINKEQKINEMIRINTNNQLNRFSKIYFDKSKINYSINEK